MKREKLALYGGHKSINYKIEKYNSIGKEELKAAQKVIKSGILSDFIGKDGKKFLGGKNVINFENKIKNYFKVKYAVVVNSWTSGLIAAFGSIGIKPGDEVILPTWTMSACAMAIINWNAIPVFVDIERNTFNIDPNLIEKKISKKTKAILAVDIFGHPANYKKIFIIAKKYNLKVISDSAQSIGSKYNKKFSGTFADIGGFSLNCHKHINTGEGGILLTNNKNIAYKLKLIRNHAESSINLNKPPKKELINMIGYNFRLGEIESAIGIEQLKKLKKIVNLRKKFANLLTKGLSNLEGLKLPIIEKNCSHSFYTYPIILNTKKIKLSRKTICKALKAEGVQVSEGYVNLHILPMFKNKIAYGDSGFPWILNKSKNYNYKKGSCPVAEKLHEKTFMHIGMYTLDYRIKDIKKIINAFQKVWRNIEILK